MMDLVESLSKEEIRNFKIFINRYKSDKDKLPVAKLFDLIKVNKLEDEDIHKHHFPDLKKNAFYRLKNRMNSDIYKSLLSLNFDKEEKISIHNYLVLASVFRYKNSFELSWKMLKKAESKAEKLDLDLLLHVVYDEIISLSHDLADIPLHEYFDKKKLLKQKTKKLSDLRDLLAEVSWRMKRSDFKSSQELLGTIDSFEIELLDKESEADSVSAKIQTQEVIRNILLHNGEYESMLAYLSKKLDDFEKDKLFTRVNYGEKIRMIVWIINANVKLTQFSEALELSDRLYTELEKYDGLYFNRFIWTYYQTVFTCAYYMGKIDLCLEKLLEWKEIKSFKEHSYFNLFYYPNLALCYFAKGEIRPAMKTLAEIQKPEIFYDFPPVQKLGFTIMDLILYYENQDFTYLTQKIKDIKRKYNHLLKLEEYNRQASFLNVLLKMSSNPNWSQNMKTMEKINSFQRDHPLVNQNRFESINYNNWLESKVERKSYYELFSAESTSKV